MKDRTYNIKLLEVKNETKNVYTFIFERPKNYIWKSGQYAIFTYPNLKTKKSNSRIFSIASSEKENEIMISTKIEKQRSDFKDALLNLEKNDTIQISDPKGEFVVSKNVKHIIGIAGGIGITPFRSIIKSLPMNIKLNLLYCEYNQKYVYKEELDKINVNNVNIEYLFDLEKINKTIDNYSSRYKNDAWYFISGPPLMINSIKKSLERKGILNIKYDPFYGY